MKIEELRLNNYVKSNLHKGLITSIMVINQTSVGLWCNPLASYNIDEISPIDLSPEILEKAGFERINSHKEWVKRNHVIKKNQTWRHLSGQELNIEL